MTVEKALDSFDPKTLSYRPCEVDYWKLFDVCADVKLLKMSAEIEYNVSKFLDEQDHSADFELGKLRRVQDLWDSLMETVPEDMSDYFARSEQWTEEAKRGNVA